MKHIGLMLALGLLLLARPGATAERPVIVVLETTAHPHFSAVLDGIRDELRSRDWVDGTTLRLIAENARADPDRASRLARRIAAIQPTLAVALGAPAARVLLPLRDRVPVFVTAVSAARARELLPHGDAPGLVQPSLQPWHLALMAATMPRVARIVLPWPALSGQTEMQAEVRAEVEAFARAARARGLTTLPLPVAAGPEASGPETASPEITDAALAPLAQPNTAMFIADLPGIRASLPTLLESASRHALPVFSALEAAVADGALASLAYDPYEVGRQAGQRIAALLEGTATTTSLDQAEPTRLLLNEDAATRLGLDLPPRLLENARLVLTAPFDIPADHPPNIPVDPPCTGTTRC